MTIENNNHKSTGIVIPLDSYGFQVEPQLMSPERSMIVMQNIEDVEFNFAKRTLKFKMRQTVLPESFNTAFDLARNNAGIIVNAVNRNSEILFRLEPQSLTLKDHSFTMGYSMNGYAYHVFEYSFSSVVARKIQTEDRHSEPASDMSFPKISEIDLDGLKKADT